MKGKKVVASVLAVASLASMFIFAGCQDESAKVEVPNNTVTEEPAYDGVVVKDGGAYALSSKMAFCSVDMLRSGVDPTALNPISVSVSAKVEPSTANQAVTWSVTWLDSSGTWSSGKTVTDYVAVASSGVSTATVTCYQPFFEDVALTATSVEGGISATCRVTFVGIPGEISVTSNDVTVAPNGDCGLAVGTTYDFNISLANSFGYVGDKFKDYEFTVVGIGKFTLGTAYVNNQTKETTWVDTYQVNMSDMLDTFFECSVSGDVLSVKIKRAIANYYVGRNPAEWNGALCMQYTSKVKSIDEDCSFKVYVRSKGMPDNSGLEAVLNFYVSGTIVTGVSISGGNIEF